MIKSVPIALFLLISFFIIFFISGNAYAQSSWVLWQKNTFYTFSPTPKEHTSWEILGAVPRYEDCIKMQMTVIGNVRNIYKSDKYPGIEKYSEIENQGFYIQYKGDNGAKHELFYCLPGTLDPRH